LESLTRGNTWNLPGKDHKDRKQSNYTFKKAHASKAEAVWDVQCNGDSNGQHYN
jgi:hypothetical protein